MWKISDVRESWATDTGRDLLASIVVSAPIRLTFGFGFRPKVPLYFRWHTRFRPNVIHHFRSTFSYDRKWNFHFRSTSNDQTVILVDQTMQLECPYHFFVPRVLSLTPFVLQIIVCFRWSSDEFYETRTHTATRIQRPFWGCALTSSLPISCSNCYKLCMS